MQNDREPGVDGWEGFEPATDTLPMFPGTARALFPADGTPYDTDRDATIRRIRAALKKRSGKDWSVKGDRGTAWGWIEIDAPPRRRTWQTVQTTSPQPPAPGAIYRGACGVTPGYRVDCGAADPILTPEDDPWARDARERGLSLHYNWEVEQPGAKYGHASPQERAELGRLLGLDRPIHHQGHNVPASSGHRREYIDRAEGRTPTVFGKTYSD